jgi:hypothetical protein
MYAVLLTDPVRGFVSSKCVMIAPLDGISIGRLLYVHRSSNYFTAATTGVWCISDRCRSMNADVGVLEMDRVRRKGLSIRRTLEALNRAARHL